MPYTPGAVRYASAPILSYTKGEPKKAMTYFRVPSHNFKNARSALAMPAVQRCMLSWIAGRAYF